MDRIIKYKAKLILIIICCIFCIVIASIIHQLYFTSDVISVSNRQMERWMSQDLVALRMDETIWMRDDFLDIEIFGNEMPAIKFINNTDYYFLYNPGIFSLFVANRNRWQKVDDDRFSNLLGHILHPQSYNIYHFNPAHWYNLSSGEYRIVFDISGYSLPWMGRENAEIPSLKVVGTFSI